MADKTLTDGQKANNLKDLLTESLDPTVINPGPTDNIYLVWEQKRESDGTVYYEAITKDGSKIYRVLLDEPKPVKKGIVEIIDNPNPPE